MRESSVEMFSKQAKIEESGFLIRSRVSIRSIHLVAEIFELQYVRFRLGVLYSFFQLILMLGVCKNEDGQSLHNTNHVMEAHLLK